MTEAKRILVNILLGILLIAILLPFVSVKETKAIAVGLPFGGRLLFTSPPIITLIVNCPAMAHVLNLGPQKGVLHLFLPPGQPKAFYNFFTPGVSTLGSYYPTPLPFNCPVQPIFPANYFGTSVR
ncbi:MAG: hypothetical protein HY336_01385 [Candidatus Doudnabacteria bacterium]|nr:hypothetical protein [Candidatus Doudnabacteria bacterium]